ncbi:MAG: hypothetical protein RBT44_11520, partial [Sphaerochaetaceae bacterium]|nr:hypothetical protein [Sphaerochaetaceae bacterium]
LVENSCLVCPIQEKNHHQEIPTERNRFRIRQASSGQANPAVDEQLSQESTMWTFLFARDRVISLIQSR